MRLRELTEDERQQDLRLRVIKERLFDDSGSDDYIIQIVAAYFVGAAILVGASIGLLLAQ